MSKKNNNKSKGLPYKNSMTLERKSKPSIGLSEEVPPTTIVGDKEHVEVSDNNNASNRPGINMSPNSGDSFNTESSDHSYFRETKLSFKEKIANIFAPYKETLEKLNEFQVLLEQKNAEISKLKDELSGRDTVITALSSEKSSHFNELAHFEKRCSNQSEELDKKDIELKQKADIISKLNEELKEAKDAISEDADVIEELQRIRDNANINEVQADLFDREHARAEKLEKEIKQQNDSILDLNKQIEEAEEDKKKLRSLVEQSKQEIESLKQQIAELEEDTTSKDKIALLQKELDDLKDVNPDAISMADLQHKCDKLAQENSELHIQVENKTVENSQLSDKLQEIKSELKNAEQKIDTAEKTHQETLATALAEAERKAEEKIHDIARRTFEEIKTKEEEADRKLASIKKEAKERYEILKLKSKQELAEEKQRSEEKLAEEKKRSEAELEKAAQNYAEKSNAYEAKIGKLKEDTSRKIDEISVKHLQEIEDLNISHRSEIKNLSDKVGEESERADDLFDNYSAMLKRIYNGIVDNINNANTTIIASSAPGKILNNTILKNDLISLTEFTPDFFMPAIDEIKERRSGNLKTNLKKVYNELLRTSSPTWLDALMRLDALLRVPFVAEQFSSSRIDTVAIQNAAANVKTLLADCGIEMEIPRLFIDTFDESRHTAEPIKNINSEVSDVASHVNNPETIVDFYTIGYHSDDSSLDRRPAVSRLNA